MYLGTNTEYSLSLQLSFVLWLAAEKLCRRWSIFSWAQGHIIGIYGGEKVATLWSLTVWPWSRSKLKGRERRGGNDGELRLMMSHYWQAVRKRETMTNRGSNEDGEGESERRRVEKMRREEEMKEKERRVKKRKRVREHLWPRAVKVSGCLSSAPMGAGSTRALISH